MPSSDLPKLWTEPTTIGHIFRFFMPKNDFESANLANFEEVVHNFCRSDDDMILWKNAYFQYVQTWFDAQFDQKILDGI
jgi:hypothetical protein